MNHLLEAATRAELVIPGIRTEKVRLANGAIANYATAGDTGPAVILVHGALHGSGGANGWRLMIPALAEAGFRVYAPDRPGFGLADTREQYWPVRGVLSWVDFVRDFADALALDAFFLAGNSQGAQIAATFTINHPERVRKLVMIASGGLSSVLDIPADRITPGLPFPQWLGTEESMRANLASIVHRPETLTDELIRARSAAAALQADAWKVGMAWARAAAADPNLAQAIRLKGRLDRLTIPMIYLYGKQDVLGPVENAYLQEDALPNVQMFYPDDCGHQGQSDQPEMFNAVVTEFFRDERISRKTAAWAGVSDRRAPLEHIVEA